MFRPGQKVVCNPGSEGLALRRGKVYTVSSASDGWVSLVETPDYNPLKEGRVTPVGLPYQPVGTFPFLNPGKGRV